MRRWSFPRLLAVWAAAVLLHAAAAAQVPAREPDRILTGAITGKDHQRYLRVPFAVPSGVSRLVVAFDHDHRAERTVIDLAVEDQDGLRGASGGNKAVVTIGRSDATPSYQAGPIRAGTWHLALAIPNIRQGVTAHWTARLWFLKDREGEALPAAVVNRGPGWYRGDLHLHTGHSDGSCASQANTRVPCPLFRTLEAASARGLDFVMLTEHNSISHHQPMREAQPWFDKLLLIPAREITTFYGHFNIFGVVEPIDFRIAPGSGITFNTIADRVHDLGGLVAINHPGMPSGEMCMGCGWTMPGVDPAKVDVVEAINGSSISGSDGQAEGPLSGLRFWTGWLAKGQAAAAIGASDNHDPDRAPDALGAIGGPATVVHANGLTTAAILDALKRGRAFIDLTGDPSNRLDVTLHGGRRSAAMGGTLPIETGQPVELEVAYTAPQGATIEVYEGELTAPIAVRASPGTGAQSLRLPIGFAPGTRAFHIRIRGSAGALLLLSNPVRVEPRLAPRR